MLYHPAPPYNPVMPNKDIDKWFIEILKENESKIFNLIFWHVGDFEEAKDLTQDVFLKVYKNLKKFRGESSVNTWVYRIALNHVNSYLRKSSSRRKTVSLNGMEDSKGLTMNSEYPEFKPEYRILRQKIKELPVEYREVIVLFYFDGKTYEEIAETIGSPIGTVKSRLNRARRILKQALEGLI